MSSQKPVIVACLKTITGEHLSFNGLLRRELTFTGLWHKQFRPARAHLRFNGHLKLQRGGS